MTSLPLVWSDIKTLVVSILVFTSPKVSSASGACSLQVSCSSSILCCCHRRCCSCSSFSLTIISSSCTFLSSSCNIFHTSSCSTVAGGRVGGFVAKEASFLATLKKYKIILSPFLQNPPPAQQPCAREVRELQKLDLAIQLPDLTPGLILGKPSSHIGHLFLRTAPLQELRGFSFVGPSLHLPPRCSLELPPRTEILT